MSTIRLSDFTPLVQAQALRAASGDGERFADAMQDGYLGTIVSIRSADPAKGPLDTWVAQHLVGVRGKARDAAIVGDISLESRIPEDGDDGEPVLDLAVEPENDPAVLNERNERALLALALIGEFAGLKMHAVMHMMGGSPAGSGLSTAELEMTVDEYYEYLCRADAGGDDTPYWAYDVPAPSAFVGEQYAVYADDDEMGDETFDDHDILVPAWQADPEEPGDDYLHLRFVGDTRFDDEEDDSELEPVYAMPEFAQSQKDLTAFLGNLAEIPGAYVRTKTYRRAFIAATLSTGGPSAWKKAGYAAWLREKARVALEHTQPIRVVSVTSAGLKTEQGRVIAFDAAAKRPWEFVPASGNFKAMLAALRQLGQTTVADRVEILHPVV